MKMLLVLVVLVAMAKTPAVLAENWNGWRGPRGDGTSLETEAPLRWDGEADHNIAWKVEVPGRGHASPIVWDERIFLVTCVEDTKERVLLCIDRDTGQTVWRRTVVKSPLETLHRLNSRASSTPATDGQSVFVVFLEVDGTTVPAPNVGTPRPITPGVMVVASYDFEGNEQWKVKAGEFISAHGFSSNPVVYDDLVIVNGDHDGDGYIVALDRASGKVRWKTGRPNNTRSYVTPIIRTMGGRTQMVLGGSLSVFSYDPHTGRAHWNIRGPTEQFVASVVSDDRFLYLTAGYPDKHILAIRPDGLGDVTDTHIAWRTTRGAAYVPSPIIEGPWLLVVSDAGIGSCFEAASGMRLWMERIGGGHSASMVSAVGKVYVLSDEGVTTVIQPGPKLDVIAKNRLGERCSASPAISGGRIYIRGEKHLYAIGASG